MKALVTGHLGFVGRHMYARLVADGWDVVGMDPALREAPVKLKLSRDLRIALHSPLYEGYQPDLVVHCAAVSPHRRAIDEQALVVGAENLSLDAELFRWAMKAKPGRIVYLSSSAAYPIQLQNSAQKLDLAEAEINTDYPDKPDGIYGWNKLTGERLCSAARNAGLKVTIVRPFSGYGTDQSEDFPFSKFLYRVLAREDPFRVWGSGEQVRDFIHIDDIVEAILRLVKCEADGPVNLGTGIGTSFNKLAAMFAAEVGYQPKIVTEPGMPVGVAYRVADTGLLDRYYTPKISLREGVRRAVSGE